MEVKKTYRNIFEHVFSPLLATEIVTEKPFNNKAKIYFVKLRSTQK